MSYRWHADLRGQHQRHHLDQTRDARGRARSDASGGPRRDHRPGRADPGGRARGPPRGCAVADQRRLHGRSVRTHGRVAGLAPGSCSVPAPSALPSPPLVSPLAPTLSTAPFRWPDGERLVVFGRGCLADAPELLGAAGYQLLTTPRAATAAPEVVAGAARVHEAPPGRVDEIAAALRPEIEAELLVALGGGRVIDVAKALAAADPPRRVAAIPTTLSGAEMTAIHRHAADVASDAPRVRPAIVIADPALSASQPLPELAASAGNALGHAAEGPLTPRANPVATLAALESARLLALGFAAPSEDPDRDALALGALLAGYVIGSTGYGLHHILSQTLVRFAGVGHGTANTILLPHTVRALERRSPDAIARLGDALGSDAARFASMLARLTGAERLRDAGVGEDALERCADEAVKRPELAFTPPPATRDELLGVYRAAW